MGNAPGYGLPADEWPSYEMLREETFCAFGDLDASPTKAWMLTHRDQPQVSSLVDLTMGLRPAEELYDVLQDPDHMHNLADSPDHATAKHELRQRLMDTLIATGDPRVTGDRLQFDRPPYAGESDR